MKILIIEDERSLASHISLYLKKNEFLCEHAADAYSAEEKLNCYSYDLILLDIGLLEESGLDLIPLIKQKQLKAGLIIISAKDSLTDKVTGLDLGADDYLTKPFQLSELHSRIKAVLRRGQFMDQESLIFNELRIDLDGKSLFVNDKEALLTKKEFQLILYFMINKNRVLTKETLAEHLWGDHADLYDNFDFIYTHLNNVRKKIKSLGAEDYIKTVYGVGYKLAE